MRTTEIGTGYLGLVIDDMREASIIALKNLLTQAGAYYLEYDLVTMEEAKCNLGGTIKYRQGNMDAIKDEDTLALSAKWTEFRLMNWEKVGPASKTNVVSDFRNHYRQAIVAEVYFDYYRIGMCQNIAEKP